MRTLRVFAVAGLVFGVVGARAQFPSSAPIEMGKDNRTLTISASDQAEADPDVADVHIAYTTYGPTLKAAYQSASDNSNTIVKALTAAGAKSVDIHSMTTAVSKLSDYETRQQKGQHYSVHQSWTVNVAPNDAALVLDAAIQAGATQDGDISWRLKNSVTLDAEAVRLATARAQAMAKELAQGTGATLGKPIFATNTVKDVGYVVGASTNGTQYQFSAVITAEQIEDLPLGKSDKNKAAAPPPPPPLSIEAPRIKRFATVQILYSLE